MPPAQYAGKSRIPIVERRAPISEVPTICAIAAGGSSGVPAGSIRGTYVLACSIVREGVCYMLLPQGLNAETVATLRAHETGHCNGWPAHHPGG